MTEISPHARHCVTVRALPGARRNGQLSKRAGGLRLAVAAPPKLSNANAALVVLRAKRLGLRSSPITLIAAETARDNRCLIEGITVATLCGRFAPMIEPATTGKPPSSP